MSEALTPVTRRASSSAWTSKDALGGLTLRRPPMSHCTGSARTRHRLDDDGALLLAELTLADPGLQAAALGLSVHKPRTPVGPW
jgi:hypothetical protein